MRRFLLLTIATMMTISMMAIGAGDGKDKANAIDFNWTVGHEHEAVEALWYNVDLAPVDDAKYLVLYVTNLAEDEAANVKVGFSAMGVTLEGLDTVVAVGGNFRLELPMEMLNSLIEDLGLGAFLGTSIKLDNVTLSLQSDQKVYLAAKVYETVKDYVKEEVANNSETIDWNSGVVLEPLITKWYEVDIASLKKNKQHLYVSFKSYATETAAILTSLLVNDSIMTLPIPVKAGFSFGQTIDYQLLAKLPVNKIRLGVTSTAKVEIATSVRSAIAADPTPCLNAINPKHGVEYVHKAGSSEWYKISLDLLKSKVAYSNIYLENKSGKTAHVTIGAVTDCQYTTGSTITLPIPAGLNIGAVAPNLLGNIVEQLVRFEKAYNKVDAADVYLQIKSDQDINFGLDVVNATTNPCLREDLVTFDWNKGAKIQAGTPVWYDVDLTTVKKTGKHVKLTFTNHTDSLVWAATIVSVDCPAKLTMPLLVPVPAGMSVDKFIDYNYFAVANVDNIYVGVVADGVLEMAATTYNAVIAPSADCLNAVEVTSDFSYIQSAGSQWYKFPMGLLNDGGHAGKISFRNLGTETATLTAGVTVGCEYAIPTYGKVKMPKELAFSLAIPTSILAKARKFIDADITEFYMQLTSDQDIVVALDMDASDLKACSAAVPFDWSNWEKNGLQLQANQDVWYEVNLRYPWEKMKKGEDFVFSVANNNNVPVDFEAAISPTCPVFFALESYATIPANVTAQQVIEFSKLAEFLKQFDRELYNEETALILEKYNAYVVLNKIDAKLGKYGKYFPVSKLEAILEQYGQYIAYAELKNLIDNREKYLSKAEIKSRLEEAKELLKDKAQEKLSIDQAIQLIDKLDAYIPYVEAETILKNYDQILPYAGGAVALLKMCEQYIPTEEIKQYIVKAKNAIPMDKIRALFDKIEARLPRDFNAYLRIKTTGDIIVEPDTILPTPDGCEDAIEYLWGTDVKVNKEAWYKVSIADVRNNDCSITLTVTNNSTDSVYADLSLYESCDADQAFMTLKNVGIAPNATRSKTISSSELPGDIDVIYLYVQPNGEMTINLSTDCPVFKYEYATVASYACGTEMLTWNDTVHVNKYLDSVYTYVVTPLVAPISMTSAILDTISGATAVLTAGVTPDMTASVAAIKAYYQSLDNDTVADVVSVAWATSAPVCGASVHTMTLTVEDECGNSQTLDYTFQVSLPALVDSTASTTICASELPYTWDGIVWEQAGVYYDTISNIYGCDSAQVIYTLDIYPIIPQAVIDTTICNGDSFTWNLSQKTYSETVRDTVVTSSVLTGCDSVVILNLTVLPELYHTYDTVRICYGESYVWPITGAGLTRPRDYSKTFKNIYGCDSVTHHLNLVVSTQVENKPTEYVTIDLGQTYTWIVDNQVLTYDAQGVYNYIVPNDWGCDSIVYTLNLTVNDIETEEHKTITDLRCDGTEYIDPITGEKHIISSLIASTQTWKDTVVVSPILDSIYTFIITPIVAPEEMSTASLKAIAAVPTLTQGALPNVTRTIEAIKAYYQGKDDETIADVDSIYWSEGSINTAIACGATTHTMTLVVEAGCDNKIITTHAFEVAPIIGVADTITICDSYTWNGKTYDATGVYTFKASSANGCDSIATLYLTINKSYAVDTAAVACDVFEWYGQKYDTTGVYTYNGTTAAGCDSIVTLALTINKSYAVDTAAVACDVFEWYGQKYDTTGVYTYNGTTSAGCDSVVTLALTINKSYAVDTIATACDVFEWYGQKYDTTGVYTYNGTTAAGCDSIVTLALTINKSYAVDTAAVACDVFEWYGQKYDTTGVYTYNGTTSAGCDSVVTLALTINKSYAVDTAAVACDVFEWYGQKYDTTGVYTYNGTTAAGCDSIVTLALTINKSYAVDTAAVACDVFEWYGQKYDTTGVYTYNGTTSAGCDSVVTLALTINKSYAVDTNAVAIGSFEWYGQTYDTTGVYIYSSTTIAGCDSVVTLYLIIHELPKEPVRVEVTVVDAVCAGTEYQGRLSTVVINKLETWTDSVRVDVDGVLTDSIYHYSVQPYVFTLPTITVDDIIAVCGKAVNVTKANAAFLAYIRGEQLYAPNAVMRWYILVDGTYTDLTYDAIDGTQSEVTLKFTITTDCGIIESDPITVQVQTPSPENDAELGKVPAYNKYGGRLLTVDLKYIKDQFDFEPIEEDVTWYLVTDGEDDIEQGKGYYLTTVDGTPLDAGQYYARINYRGTTDGDCDMVLQTVILKVETQVGPKLAPTVAKPNDLIRLLNLDANAISTVRMYSAAGELLDTFQVTDMKETSFHAAQTAGYYIVEVQTEIEKVSLRYIVK